MSYASHTDPIITAPTGIQDNDTLALLFDVGANPTPPVPTPPTGFSLVGGFPLTMSDSNGFTVKLYLWTKIAASESGDYQVIHSNASSTAFLWAVSGADTVSPLSPAPTTNQGLGTTATALSLTTTVDQSLVVYWVSRWNWPGGTFDSGGTTPAFTERNDPSVGLFWVGSGVMSPAGATGDKIATGLPQVANEPWASGLISFKAASTPGGITRNSRIMMLHNSDGFLP